MPAIQPARLRQQVVMLSEHFDNPVAFARSLHYLFEYYADRTRKPGQSGNPPPLIKSYHVHPPVIKQLLQELKPLVKQNPERGLALCDQLWDEPYLEFRLLSIHLLGEIDPNPSEVIIQRVQSWITSELDPILLDSILLNSLAKLREQYPHTYINLINNWIGTDDIFLIQMGLRALLPLIQDTDFENLPILIKIIQPFTRSSLPAIKPDLLDVLTALAHKRPSETAFFLQHTLNTPEAHDTAWIIRQILDEFPSEIQNNLKLLVRERRYHRN